MSDDRWIAGKKVKFLLLVAVLVIGGSFVWLKVVQTDNQMRTDMVRQAQLMVQTFNVDRIKTLTGSSADLMSASYQRLKGQLATAKRADPRCRFLYLTGRRADGSIFFLVDSEPPDSKDYSPPGQVYQEAPKGFVQVFRNWTAAVEGPYTDRWGTWVSALVPVNDRQAPMSRLATPVVLGIDIDARRWNWTLARAAVPPVVLTLVFVAVLLTGWKLLALWSSPSGGRRVRRLKYLKPALATALGLVLTLFAAWLVHERELLDRKEAFAQLAESRTEVVAQMLFSLRDTELEGLARFLETGGGPNAEKFRQFTAYLARNPAVEAWGWVPCVAAADRYRFEQEARAEGSKGFGIWEKDSAGRQREASGRNVYYPLFRMTPSVVKEPASGYDLGSEPLIRAALEEAERTGLPACAGPTTLLREKSSQKVMVFCRPVLGAASPKRLRGFALAVLRVETMLEGIIHDDSVLMEISLLHGESAAEPLVFSRDGRRQPAAGVWATRPLFAFGKVFAVTAHAGPEFVRLHPLRAGWLAILIGILLTAAFTAVISLLLGHREELEQEVLERTAALRETEALQRLLLDNLPTGVVIVDPVTRVIEGVNGHALLLYGAPEDHLLGHRCHALLCPALEGACPICDLGQSEDNTERVMVCADGSRRPVLKSVRRIQMGGQEKLLECFVDIAERKQAEENLRVQEGRLRAITESAQDAILMMDPAGEISFWNPAAEHIFGYSRDEAIGKNLHDLLAPERYRTSHREAFGRFGETGQGNAVGKTLELEARGKDGTEIPVELSLSVLELPDGWHAVGIMRDISTRKQVEKDLMESNQRLKDAMDHANVLAVQAKMASAAKSEFLANMSHEIRTPMNGIIGMTGLLLDTDLSEEQRRYADTVRNSGESLLGLINDILDFSKIEAGKLEMESLDFDLLSLLDDFAETMALRAHHIGLEFLCAADPDVPTLLKGDPGRLRQILTNLAGNAIKFTRHGEVAVGVSLESETDERVLLRFSVRDTGIGIPADKMNLLFDKFTQVDASTTRQYGGTGLGLAISKQLTEMMGGEIGVESVEGKGSEFFFTVRMSKQAGRPKTETNEPVDLHGVRALIVDDNETGREILATWLTSWGMRPAQSPDGACALEALIRAADEGDPFEVGLIDMQMPHMDGETLGRTIKGDTRLTGIRLLMLTSLGTRGDAGRFREIGFAGYLTKPMRQQELRGVLSMVMSQEGDVPVRQHIVTRHTVREASCLYDGRKARILLAEDNITNQQVALAILRKLGLRADAVANGAEAVKALESIPYDLVLMDVQMPVMDGLGATRRIRDPRSRVLDHGIPVIAMTAHAMQGDREKCLDAGMSDYLSKPVLPQTMAAMLQKWLPRGTDGEDLARDEGEEVREKPAQASGPPVWDRAGMLERLMGDGELVQMIVAGFLEDIPGQILTMKKLVDTGDVSAAERQAHAIKGAAANVGGERLREVAFAIERAGKAGDLGVVNERLGELEEEFERLRAAMQ